MAGFNAAEMVEADPLDYDFRKIGPKDETGQRTDIPGLEDAHGTTPEPSAAAVRHLRYVVREVTRTPEDETDQQAADRLAAMSEDDFAALDDKLIEAVSGCTGEYPSRKQIELLPSRLQASYLAYFYMKMLNPMTAGDASSGSPALNPSV